MNDLRRHIRKTDCRAQSAVGALAVDAAVRRFEERGGLHVLLLAQRPDPLLRAVATDANIKMGHVAELHMLTGPAVSAGGETVVVVGPDGKRQLRGDEISGAAILAACSECHTEHA